MRLLHTSDWQLGMTRHFLAGEAQSRFAQARLDVVGRLAQLATDRDCAAVVVAGDVFETNQPDPRTVTRALEALGRFHVPVFLLPGNHDPYDAASVYRNPIFVERCPSHVHVLTDTAPRRQVPGLEVVGAPWTSKAPLNDLVADACATLPADGTLRVVVGHGSVASVSGGFDAPGTIDLERVEAALDAGAAHYVALGDRHSCTSVGASGRVRYAGAPEPTSYVEEDPGTALIVDLAPNEAEVERVEVAAWRFHRIAQAVTSDRDLDALVTALDAIEDPSRAIVKVSLEGTLDLRQAAWLDALLEDRALRFAALEQPARHRDVAVRASDDDLASLELTGYADVARRTLLAQTASEGADARAATDALGLLLRLAGGAGARA